MELLKDKFKEQKMNNIDEHYKNSKQLMTVHDVAERLNCSMRLIYSMKSYGRMPLPIKLGKLVRWDGNVIEKWISDGCPSLAKEIKHFKWK